MNGNIAASPALFRVDNRIRCRYMAHRMFDAV